MKRLWSVVMVGCVVGACASASDSNPSHPAHEVVVGAGRIRGGGMRMDVALGHAFSQAPIAATGRILKSASAVTP